MSPAASSTRFGPVSASAGPDDIVVRNDFFEASFRRTHPAVSFREGLVLRCLPAAAPFTSADEQLELRINDPVLVRIVHTGSLGPALTFRITYDSFQSRNLHVYVRLEAAEDVVVSELELPRLEPEKSSVTDSETGGRWADLGPLGVVVKK